MKTIHYSHCLFLLLGLLLLTGCSSLGGNTKESITLDIQAIKFASPKAQQRVIIYNHGITRPQEREACNLSFNRPPPSILALQNVNTLIYPLCSTATEALTISAAGRQVYLRKNEINHAIDAFLTRGIKPKHLFLAGHSNGAWTSLMMMRDVNKRFNALIGFAPAFAGKRDEAHLFPWWRNRVRPAQIRDMLGAKYIDALIFAYKNDAYNRPEDLQFLTQNYPKKKSNGVKLVSYDCGLKYPHITYRKDCHLPSTIKTINSYIETQISDWKY